MKIYEKWTLQVSGEEELLLFDGFAYHNEGYDRLHQLCNDTCITTPEGRKVWLDSFLFFNEKDAISKGICESNEGEWESENVWKYSSFYQGIVVTIRYYLKDYTVKDARQRLSLSQTQLSRLLEIPLRTLQDWEYGKRKISSWVEKLVIEKLENMQPAQQRVLVANFTE